jgi:UTP--glucose-1-phosphate uridylyltransferase
MLPLVDKPVIQYAIEEAIASGIKDIVLVTGRGKRAIEDHFDIAFELEAFLFEKGSHDLLAEVREIAQLANLFYVRQKRALGLGHAVLTVKGLMGGEPFAVFLGDDLIVSEVPVMKQMIDVFEREKCTLLAVERVPREMTASYGIVKVEGGSGGRLHRVLDLVEKPEPDEAPSDLAIIGRYILAPEIFQHLEKTVPDRRGEIQLTDGLRSLLAEHEVWAYEFEGTRYDTGTKLGFLKATVEYALRRTDVGPAFREYLKSLVLD